jgi:hypothetical protein
VASQNGCFHAGIGPLAGGLLRPCQHVARLLLRRCFEGVTMGLRRDSREIRRWLRSLDGLDDAMSWLETRALVAAWMPF